MNDRIIESRSANVVKANYLITNVSLDLTELEQKIVVFAISRIKPEQKEFEKVCFSIDDYYDTLGIKQGGCSDISVTVALKNLADKSKFIRFRDNPKDKGRDVLIRWFEKAIIDYDTRKIFIRFDEELKPYLLDLHEHFTAYPLINTLSLSGKYTVRFYEILKSYSYRHRFVVSIKELREMLNIKNKYPNFPLLNYHVIQPAVDQINFFTDLEVQYSYIKERRSVIGIEFYVDTIDVSPEEQASEFEQRQIDYERHKNYIQKHKKELKELSGQVNLFGRTKEGNNK